MRLWKLAGFGATIDRHGILAGEDWQKRLGALIRDADYCRLRALAVVGPLQRCAWEVEEAVGSASASFPCSAARSRTRTAAAARRAQLHLFLRGAEVAGLGIGLPGWRGCVGAQHRSRLAARAHALSAARDGVGRGRQASDPASVRPRHRRGQGLGGAPARKAPEPTPLQLDFIKASEAEESAGKARRRSG